MNNKVLVIVNYIFQIGYYTECFISIPLIFILFSEMKIQQKAFAIVIGIPIKGVFYLLLFIFLIARTRTKKTYLVMVVLIIVIAIQVVPIVLAIEILIIAQSGNVDHQLCNTIDGYSCKFIIDISVLLIGLEFCFYLILVVYKRITGKSIFANKIVGNAEITQNTSSNTPKIKRERKYTYTIPPNFTTYNSSSNAVGIDFGTTECCAAVIRAQGPDCVELDITTGFRTLPSYVAYDEDKPKCGKTVIDRIRNYASSTVFDVKRLLGKNLENIPKDPIWPFRIHQVEDCVTIELKTPKGIAFKAPEEVSADILKHIKFKLDQYQNRQLSEAVIAIPSTFSEQQKEALSTAAKLAGWEKQVHLPEHSKILIFDFGGGTIDVCVVQAIDGKIHQLSDYGNDYLGGRDFDKMLYNQFSGILSHQYKIDVSKINKSYFLMQKCQEIKHNLSTYEDHWLDVSDFDSAIEEQINITRQEFEDLASSFTTRITNVILEALKAANLQKDEIDYVVQVGGSSRMPMIKNLLSEMFSPEKLKCCKNSDWIIAEDAALYSYFLENE